jgi:predicted house-cleaning noncanonical NTP pyrophosphatase (MazG superfamily)
MEDKKMNDIISGKIKSYNWTIKQDGKYKRMLYEKISKEIDETSANKIFNDATKILSNLAEPNKHKNFSKTGILVGKVQSGKTASFIATTALAFDNGYKITIVFGGVKKPLLEQSNLRIKSYFSGDNDIVILNSIENKNLFDSSTIERFLKLNKKIILIVLKNPDKLEIIKNIFEKSDTLKNEEIIVFDDEGDEASLNGLVYKGKQTPTYSFITELKKILSVHTYISVTATPQANLLIKSIDSLSPDFGYLIEPGKGYCGLDTFHGISDEYCIPIPENESAVDQVGGIPQSFENAIYDYIVSSSIQKLRVVIDPKFSMLIHTSVRKDMHLLVKHKVDSFLKSLRDKTKYKNDLSYLSLKNKLKAVYKINFENKQNIPPFEDLEDEIIYVIDNCQTHIMNDENQLNDADKYYDFNIYIGGNTLGRGLTIKGLGITYITRTSNSKSNVDTLQQRARWFGYREQYLDLCRIYARIAIINNFRIIRDHEVDIWETIKTAKVEGKRFKDIKRIFSLSGELKLTRGNVARTESSHFSLWNPERTFNIKEYNEKNNELIDSFFKKYRFNTIVKGKKSESEFRIISNLNFNLFFEEFHNKFKFPIESVSDLKTKIDVINKILKRKKLTPKVDVIIMRYGTESKHKVINTRIPEYMVGRNKQSIVESEYKGDRYEFINENIQVQIHNIFDIDKNTKSRTLSIYLPEILINELSGLVTREGELDEL